MTLKSLAAVPAVADDRPNILWLASEDNGISWVSCYGATNGKTPTIDQLAAEGFRYTHCFDNAAVCAPTRSTWRQFSGTIQRDKAMKRDRSERDELGV